MKQDQMNQKEQKYRISKDKIIGKADTDSTHYLRKSDDVSFADIPEEPETPATPTTPGREYEDPGHEHTYQPPTDNPAAYGSIKSSLGK